METQRIVDVLQSIDDTNARILEALGRVEEKISARNSEYTEAARKLHELNRLEQKAG